VITFVKDATHAVFGVDGRVPRTFRALVAAPGTLTAEFLAGRRRAFLSPIQTFLLANLLYFLSIPFTGTSTFTTPLRAHLEGGPHSRLAVEAVRTRMVEGHDFREYERRFDAASERQSRSLVIVMVPLFALAGALLFARSRHSFVEHLVFALHFYAFLLLLLTALTVALDLVVRVPAVRTSGLVTDRWISLLVFVVATVYAHRALRRAFGGGRTAVWLRAFALAASAVLILIAYRTILFFTVYLTVR
jgi:Protein of unknown function (DUF3667)